jgi:hypothetical protein
LLSIKKCRSAQAERHFFWAGQRIGKKNAVQRELDGMVDRGTPAS